MNDKELSGIALMIVGAITALVSSQILDGYPLGGLVGMFIGVGMAVVGVRRFS